MRRALISGNQKAGIEAAGQNALADFKVQATNDLDYLRQARGEVEAGEHELADFREANGLKRLPRVTSQLEQNARWLFIAVFMVIESSLHGLFFAKGSEFGIIGGFVEAVALSALNIGSAVLFARLALPRTKHFRTTTKITGYLLAITYTAWILWLNLGIGHYRDLFSQNQGNVPLASLIGELAKAPFDLAETRSMILVLLGLALNIVAVIDVAGIGDPYPGYGAIGHRRASAIKSYMVQKSQYQAELMKRRDEAIAEMNEAINEIESASLEVRLAIEGRNRLHRDYRAFLDHLNDCYHQLLQRYRESNMQARTAPSPARFQRPSQRPTSLQAPELPAPDLSSADQAAAIALVEHYIKQINEQFTAAIDRYQTIVGLIGERDS
jgi:hypothetical protein